MEKAKTPSKPTTIIRTIFTTLFCLAAIFIPAGTLKWTEAWVFIILYAVAVTAAVIDDDQFNRQIDWGVQHLLDDRP